MAAPKKRSLTSLAETFHRTREVKKPEKTESIETDSGSEAPPVSEEIVAELKQRAEAAAHAEDMKREAVARAEVAKQQLLDFMQKCNLKSLPMPDREPIRVVPPENGKDVTKRGLFKALEDDPKEAERIWNALPKKTGGKYRVEVPPRRVDEISEPS
jgi:hypothetical protein